MQGGTAGNGSVFPRRCIHFPDPRNAGAGEFPRERNRKIVMNEINRNQAAADGLFVPEGLLINTARNRELTASVSGLEDAMRGGIILEGTVVLCDASLNLHVRFPALPEVEGIIPRAEAVRAGAGETVKDIAVLTRVGKAVCFLVQSLSSPDEVGRVTALLSRRAAQELCFGRYVSSLVPGDVIRGRVTHMEPFGAFVDVGCGIPSLLSVDAVSVSRIDHPRDRLYNGELIWAVVRSVDGVGRLSLSMRELLGTWRENADRFRPGQTVPGILRSVESYGIFIELAPNLAGLAELRDRDPDLLRAAVGRSCAVYIKSILPERMKVKLVLIDVPRPEESGLPRLSYFVRGDRVRHLDRWVYSPEECARVVMTEF